ncbi:MAG: hypothetical protein JW720_15625 [Sedimentisphaerales bacterium]|nr:hypothetical protein [Sedimentisphaerales bacterium]
MRIDARRAVVHYGPPGNLLTINRLLVLDKHALLKSQTCQTNRAMALIVLLNVCMLRQMHNSRQAHRRSDKAERADHYHDVPNSIAQSILIALH